MSVVDDLINLAMTSPSDNYRVATIITNKRGIPVASATNLPGKTHPKQARYAQRLGEYNRIYLHSEICALIRNRSDDAYAMHVLRLGRNGIIRASRPCIICWTAIEESGIIEEVWYSTEATNDTGRLMREAVS